MVGKTRVHPACVEATYIDAISAMDSMTKNMPKQTTRNIQIPPAVPPLFSAIPIIL